MKYVLILTLISLFACEKDLPTTPTVIDALVIDENEKPFYAIPYQFIGMKRANFLGSEWRTFVKSGTSNENGVINVSKVVPKSTDWVYVEVFKLRDFDFRSKNNVQVSINDSQFIPWADLRITSEYYGKEIKLIFKIMP